MTLGANVYRDVDLFGSGPDRRKIKSPRKSKTAFHRDPPRVAFFTDCFHEINGVALTSRQLTSFARKNGFPFLPVYCTPRDGGAGDDHPFAFPMTRGPATIPVERDLGFDLFLWRYLPAVRDTIRAFRPDVIHVTSPGDVGLLGAYLAHKLRIPLVASWHTNLQEYASRRLHKLLSFLPDDPRNATARAAEHAAMRTLERFYRIGRVLLAPNPEIAEHLRRATGKPTYLMMRGVDTTLFSPSKRTVHDGLFRIGFVGRLSPEKNVRFLAELESALLAAGRPEFRFLIVGDGSERPWLMKHLRQADFPGVLEGEELAKAYANMDTFAFPSHTDTFGNVILEAKASGVPAIVTSGGGPKFLVTSGVDGFVTLDKQDFIRRVLWMMSSPASRPDMARSAREEAVSRSWDRVFHDVYDVYTIAARPQYDADASKPQGLIPAHGDFHASHP